MYEKQESGSTPPNHNSICLMAQMFLYYSNQDPCQRVPKKGKMQTADGRPSVFLWKLKEISERHSKRSQILNPVPSCQAPWEVPTVGQ